MKKFTCDPEKRYMLPGPGSKRTRNGAFWDGFWLTDSELDAIVEDIIEEYLIQDINKHNSMRF